MSLIFNPSNCPDPNVMKKLQVDRGAIKFVLSGANIMCPGLTSPGGTLDDEVEAETPVVRMVLYICYEFLGPCERSSFMFCTCFSCLILLGSLLVMLSFH